MSPLVPYIWVAGVVHLLIAASNILLPRKLQYQANLSKVSPIIRQIFLIHSVYIVMVVIAFGGLCFFFARDLTGGSLLGTFLSGWLAIFWLSRAFVQIFCYDPNVKRQHPLADAAFTVAILYLGGVFAIAVLRIVK